MSDAMPTIRFLVTYYGAWPGYFRMWADSVAANPEIEVVFITDLPRPDWLPANVRLHQLDFEGFMQRMEQLLEQPLPRLRYHKLCDYKPLYALAFPELIGDVPYWGYCDVDLVFGDLYPLVAAARRGDYDILSPFSYTVGHCCVVRNEERALRIALHTEQLIPRLHQPGITFIDEGAFSETALRLGGFRFRVAESLGEEWRLPMPFLGATIQPGGTLSGLDTDHWLIHCEPGRTVVHVRDGTQHEVLYVHFMAMKQPRFWSAALREHLRCYTVTPYGIVPGHLDPGVMRSMDYRVRRLVWQAAPRGYALARSVLPTSIIDAGLRFYKRLRPKAR